MIERIIESWCYLLLLLIMISSCTGRKGSINTADPTACNSIYYWKTTFFQNDYEQSFLQEHDIHRMYVKFFDVDDDAPSPYVDAKRKEYLNQYLTLNTEKKKGLFITL